MVQGQTEILREKPIVVPLAPPQIPHKASRHRTRPRGLGWQLTAHTTLNKILQIFLMHP
jgi:hypothetical protein